MIAQPLCLPHHLKKHKFQCNSFVIEMSFKIKCKSTNINKSFFMILHLGDLQNFLPSTNELLAFHLPSFFFSFSPVASGCLEEDKGQDSQCEKWLTQSAGERHTHAYTHSLTPCESSFAIDPNDKNCLFQWFLTAASVVARRKEQRHKI